MNKVHESAYEELRDTLGEHARIVRRRWRWGVLALSLLSSVSFWCSQYVPRRYTATTVFQRRDDAVLQDLVRQNSPYGFDHLKSSLTLDTTGMRAKADAAMTVGLLAPGSIAAEGALSAAEMQLLDAALARVRLTAEVRLTVTTAAFDVIELRAEASEPGIAQRFVTALRDQYIEATRQRISSVLENTRHFFENQLEHGRQQAASSAAELDRYFADAPDPGARDLSTVSDRLDAARSERDRLSQELARLEAQVAARSDFLAAGQAALAAAPTAASADQAPVDPAAAGLERALRKVEDEIVDAIVVRQMTREHPSVRALERKRDALREVSATVSSQPAAPAPAPAPDTAASVPAKSPLIAQVELEFDALRRQSAVVRERLQDVEARFQGFQRLHQKLVEGNAELHRLEERRGQDLAATAVWRQHLAQLKQVTAAESGQRGTQFALIEEPKSEGRALSPKLSAVMAVCSGIGIAAAFLVMMIIELFDRSILAPARVTHLTGVPVLECIGVIATPRETRRKLLRAGVWIPALTLSIGALALSAALAYISIEQPGLHRRAGVILDPILRPIGLPPIADVALEHGGNG